MDPHVVPALLTQADLLGVSMCPSDEEFPVSYQLLYCPQPHDLSLTTDLGWTMEEHLGTMEPKAMSAPQGTHTHKSVSLPSIVCTSLVVGNLAHRGPKIETTQLLALLQ